MKMESARKRFNATLLRQNCNKTDVVRMSMSTAQTSSTAFDLLTGLSGEETLTDFNRMYG